MAIYLSWKSFKGKQPLYRQVEQFENKGTIGRATDNDFVLHDPDKYVSRYHAVVNQVDGNWFIQDTSSTSTVINNKIKLERGQSFLISEGDKIAIGDSILLVDKIREEQEVTQLTESPQSNQSLNDNKQNVKARKSAIEQPQPIIEEPPKQPEPVESQQTPEPVPRAEPQPQFDPVPQTDPQYRPEPAPPVESQQTPEPVPKAEPQPQPDPVPQTEPEYRPDPVPQAEPQYKPEPAPQDEPQYRPEPLPQAEPQYRPDPIQQDPIHQPVHHKPIEDNQSGYKSHYQQPVHNPAPAIQQTSNRAEESLVFDIDDFFNEEPETPVSYSEPEVSQNFQQETEQTPKHTQQVPPSESVPPAQTMQQQKADVHVDTIAIREFLRELGVHSSQLVGQQRVDVMRTAGVVLKTLTEGMMGVLNSRSLLKEKLMLDQTQIMQKENNPFKFSDTPEEALVRMLTNEPGFLDPVSSAREAVDDAKAHQMAMISGLNMAIQETIDSFDPKSLEEEFKFGFTFSKKAKYWDIYCEIYESIAESAQNDSTNLFIKHFREHYALQLSKLKK